eukprot:56522-Heterocapsa_arctica.AAC.1
MRSGIAAQGGTEGMHMHSVKVSSNGAESTHRQRKFSSSKGEAGRGESGPGGASGKTSRGGGTTTFSRT